jgi:glutamate-1-semialdehyde 2,1-aminomutase
MSRAVLAGLSLDKLSALHAAETARFAAARPSCAALAQASARHWRRGVPMHWMRDWPTPFPIAVADANGAVLTDIDGNAYDDFCLGDTGSMFGHAPGPVVRAIAEQSARGLTFMLPTADTPEVGQLLSQRFGLPYWQMTVTATDANRYAIRWARAITGRPKLLVFNGCYHGAADDTFVRLDGGAPILRPGLIGQVYDVRGHTRVVEFNDLAAVEAALAQGDVAAVLTEPVLTNIGMVPPEPGFLEALAAATKRAGALLILDETHSISSGPGGYAAGHGIAPDMLTMGKPIAGGIPAGIFGFSAAVNAAMDAAAERAGLGYSGMGATLSANALTQAAMRAMLTQVMTPAAYAHMLTLSQRLRDGLTEVIASRRAPWSVAHVGARVELVTAPVPPRNGSEAKAALHAPILAGLHLFLINRGLLIAPFHNMMLLSPVTTLDQVNRLVQTIDGFLVETLA